MNSLSDNTLLWVQKLDLSQEKHSDNFDKK